MPGGGCLTARGLRNVVIASGTICDCDRHAVPARRRAVARGHSSLARDATRAAARPALGSVAGMVLVLSGVARAARIAAWLVALRLALVPVTYGLDRALAWLRVPKRRAWALPVWLHRLALAPKPAKSVCAFPSCPNAKTGLRRACWAFRVIALGLRFKFPTKSSTMASWGGRRFRRASVETM